MPDLAMRTITFLCIDFVADGDRQHRQGAWAVPAAHDALLHRIIPMHNGVIFKTAGPVVYAAFATAPDALTAAIAVQRSLCHNQESADHGMPARMALHTGVVDAGLGDYAGQTLTRSMSLLAAGHPKQILLSLATQELVRDYLPPDVELHDLGEHRLNDLARPEHIFVVAADDLPGTFPPLKTLSARPNNLPLQPTPFIGREREVRAVRMELLRPDARLVTLTGPGGTGKTRLGLQAAAELLNVFADGVFFVSLAPIREAALVASTIAQTLGLRQAGDQALADSLKDYLHDKDMLLVLDNFEQVVDAAPLVADLLMAADRLKVLVTSRAVLGVYGEHDYAVPSLTLPDPKRLPTVEQLSQYEAVRLFIERAQAARADFSVTNDNAPAIAEICFRLDGLPLAIELAAARIRLLPPPALLSRLSNRLKLLTGGPRTLPPRQQTLRSTIDWSYDLLSVDEQKLLRRLAVFVGGRTLEAAEAVCNVHGGLALDILDGIQSLLDKSLLWQVEGVDGEPRFVMLETIWEYALERLEESGELAALRRAHAAYFLSLVKRADPELRGPGQTIWLNRLEAEHDNLRAVLRWGSEGKEVELALQLGGLLWRFWKIRGYISEGREQLGRLLALPAASVYKAARAKALGTLGILAHFQGDLAAARSCYEESLTLQRELDNKRGIASMLNNLGIIAMDQGDYIAARSLYEQCLVIERELGDRGDIAGSLMNLANVAILQGDGAAARSVSLQCLDIVRELGDKEGSADCLLNLASVEYNEDNYAAARSYAEASLATSQEMGYKWGIGNSLIMLGDTSCMQGDYAAARSLARDSLLVLKELGDKRCIAHVLESCAHLALVSGHVELAVQLVGAAAALREQINVPVPPVERVRYQQREAAMRARVDQAAFEEAWTAGRAMTLEQALALALDVALLEQTDVTPPPASAPAAPVEPKRGYPAGLTAREVEVLRLVAQGLTDAEVAEKLIVSRRTVNAHLSSIYSKLGVSSRTAAARFAIDHRLV